MTAARTARTLSKRAKALTLVPLALLSGVWTASLVTTSASVASASKNHALPDGTRVPTTAIQAPASVPVPGEVAPAVPEGSEDSVVSGASSNGIPAPALSAYQRAAQIIDSADKTCNIPWELIGAIGRVESDHGRYGGNTLTDAGFSKPGIYGIELNGKNGTQVVHDTDGGQIDHDPVYDRAVGPMQFIPSTWQVDADGDNKRDPQDINDASLATAVYLCSGTDNLGTRKGQEAAVLRYNHSQNYVNLVLRIMEAYSSGDYTALPSGTYGGDSFSSSGYSSAIDKSYKAAKVRKQKAAKAKATAIANGTYKGPGSTTSGSGAGSSSGSGGSGGGIGGTGIGGSGGSGSGTKSGSNPVGDAVNGVTGTVGGIVKGATGGGSGSGGSSGGSGSGGGGSTPTPPPPPKLTAAEAKVQCLASGISALNLPALNACIANLLK